MVKNATLIIALLVGMVFSGYAQASKTAVLKGRVKNQVTKAPFNQINVSLLEQNLSATTDGNGNFEFSGVTFGTKTIVFDGANAASDTESVNVDKELVEMPDVYMKPTDMGFGTENAEIPTITTGADNSESNNADFGAISTGTGLIGSRNPFLGMVNNLAVHYGFQPRGYRRNTRDIEINGIPMNNVETGNADWASIGGLYDVFHTTSVTYGLSPSPYTFGGINGFTYIAATAADQRKEVKLTYSRSDNNNINTTMVSVASGEKANGWSFAGSFAKRWSLMGASYTPGVFLDEYSYYAAASKKIGRGTLNITTFGAPRQQARSAAATLETYKLAGNNYYNHNWGYMPDSSIRNDAVQSVFQPVTIINYLYQPNESTRWNTAIGYEFGKDKTSSLQGNNDDPSVIGDYYRNLPSYYYTYFPPDSTTGNIIKQEISKNPKMLQLNWNRMYQANYSNTLTLNNVDGIAGKSYTGKQSIYVIGDAVKDLQKITFNTNLEHASSARLSYSTGLTVIGQQTEYYDQLTDLLGGDYFVNFNQFASQQYIGNPNYNQNNLNDPNQVIKVGDKFAYDYTIHSFDAYAWGQAIYKLNKVDFFVAVQAGNSMFYREGFMRNGLFSNHSYGTSSTNSFIDYSAKGGINFEINKHNYLFANAAYTVNPPNATNTYISARTRDFLVPSPTTYTTQSFEGGYMFKHPKTTFKITGYVTDVNNITEIKSFYNDDPAFRTFVNYVMQGENNRHIGIESQLEYKLSKSFSLLGLVSLGQSFYTNDPTILVYLDNDTIQQAHSDKAYIKNYYISAGPQSSFVGEVTYHSRKGYHATLTGNYFDGNYVQINPNRRTQAAADKIAAGSTQWHAIYDQEKLPSVFTMDISVGRTMNFTRNIVLGKKLPNSTLTVNATISNLTNTEYLATGFEQLRFDFAYHNPDKFQNKYYYGKPINFRLNISLRF
jgi:CarboxypepD_reg-like domain